MLKLLPGDCLDIMPTLPAESVDAVVTDPPYGLDFMGNEWDRFGGDKPSYQEWCTLWAAQCLRLLKPGGHLVSFGGTRTWHRLTSGIEDAGFEIRDSLMWVYGQGFPKSLNVGDGRGTALKPSHEPIVLARKPPLGNVKFNVSQFGTGALNVDDCRVITSDPTPGGLDKNHPARINDGRWPPNLLLNHDASCTDDECSDQCPIPALDEQSGISTSRSGGVVRESSKSARGNTSPAFGEECRPPGTPLAGHNDTGGASRYFPKFRYNPKASTKERPTVRDDEGRLVAHPTVKPVSLMQWVVRLVTPPNGVVLDPFAGSGTTGEACIREGFDDAILIEANPKYIPLMWSRMSNFTQERTA